jgi:probable rRNA maturation factor
VLTFDYVQEPEIEADLVLCAPVVEREQRSISRPLRAPAGARTLHAQGYDHEDDGPEAACMEARETTC